MFTHQKTQGTNERGALMIEAIALLGLMTMMSPMIVRQTADRTAEMEEVAVAGQMKEIKDALSNWIAANYQAQAKSASESGELDKPITVSASDLAPYLPASLLEGDAGSGTIKFRGNKMVDGFKIGVRMQCTEARKSDSSACEAGTCYTLENGAITGITDPLAKCSRYKMTGVVVSDNSEELHDRRASRIATMIGADGGYMRSSKMINAMGGEDAEDEAKKILGAQGIWEIDSTDNYFGADQVATGGRIAATTVYSSGFSGDYLYRKKVDGLPDANSMFTDLDMGGGTECNADGCHKINNAGGLEVVNGKILIRSQNNPTGTADDDRGSGGPIDHFSSTSPSDTYYAAIALGLDHSAIHTTNTAHVYSEGYVTIGAGNTFGTREGGSRPISRIAINRNTIDEIEFSVREDDYTGTLMSIKDDSVTTTLGNGNGSISYFKVQPQGQSQEIKYSFTSYKDPAPYNFTQSYITHNRNNTEIRNKGALISMSTGGTNRNMTLEVAGGMGYGPQNSIRMSDYYGISISSTDRSHGGDSNVTVKADDNINMTAAGNVTVKANDNINMTAEENITAKASGDVDLSAGDGASNFKLVATGFQGSAQNNRTRYGLTGLDGLYFRVNRWDTRDSSMYLNDSFYLYLGKNPDDADDHGAAFKMERGYGQSSAKLSFGGIDNSSQNIHLYGEDGRVGALLLQPEDTFSGSNIVQGRIRAELNSSGNMTKAESDTSNTARVEIDYTEFGGIKPYTTHKTEIDSGKYDRFRVDPAFTSVMNDIVLTSRGGAHLSDALPNYILKGIYVLNNDYVSGPWPCESTADDDACTFYMPYIEPDITGGYAAPEHTCSDNDDVPHPMKGSCNVISGKYVKFNYYKSSYTSYSTLSDDEKKYAWAHPFVGYVPAPGRDTPAEKGLPLISAKDEGPCPDGYQAVLTITPNRFDVGKVTMINPKAIFSEESDVLYNFGFEYYNNASLDIIPIIQPATSTAIMVEPVTDSANQIRYWKVAMGAVAYGADNEYGIFWNPGGVPVDTWQAAAHTYCYFNPERFTMPNMTIEDGMLKTMESPFN